MMVGVFVVYYGWCLVFYIFGFFGLVFVVLVWLIVWEFKCGMSDVEWFVEMLEFYGGVCLMLILLMNNWCFGLLVGSLVIMVIV